jgi:phosphoglycerate dehydrogenase-like enzyme
MLPSDGLDTLLRESDFIAVCVPLTSETRGMLGKQQFAMMKPNAIIINIARGAVIDQDAMIRALQDRRIAGAGLDVTTPEPLPADSPLWDMPNVIISPHVSGLNPCYGERAAEIFLRNLHAYVNGDIQGMPTLVDRRLGY